MSGVNATMRRHLAEAVRQRAPIALGHPSPNLDVLIHASLEMEAAGFTRETLWRALELATRDACPDGDACPDADAHP